jgi:tRNA pseudouridine65 synthase
VARTVNGGEGWGEGPPPLATAEWAPSPQPSPPPNLLDKADHTRRGRGGQKPFGLVGASLQPLTILYRDDDLVVVSKPSGMLVHRGWARDRVVAMTVVRDLLGRYVYPVHRLDRGTSGAVIFALESPVARRIQEAFQAGKVEKRYLTLVRGIPPEEGTIDHPIPRSPGGERVPAVSDYRRLATFERYALLEVRPRTGRLHQIRRHLKHISHHVIGDVRYGKGEHNRYFRERFQLHRLVLHALEIAFEHPTTGVPLRVRAPLGDDLAGPFAAMGFVAPSIDLLQLG